MSAGLAAVPEIVLDDAVGIRVGRRKQGRRRNWVAVAHGALALVGVTTGAVSTKEMNTAELSADNG